MVRHLLNMMKSDFIHTCPGRGLVPFYVEIVKAGAHIRGVFGLEKQILIPYNSKATQWSCRRSCSGPHRRICLILFYLFLPIRQTWIFYTLFV